MAAFGLLSVGAVVLAIMLASYQPAAAQGSTAQGASVYRDNCAECHGDQGGGATEGPSLKGLPAVSNAIPGVEDVVRNGLPDMDAFGSKLSNEEIQAVADYVVSEFATQGDVPTGGEDYRLICAGCHGVTLRGGALIYNDTNAPDITKSSPPVVVSAIRVGFGTMPAFSTSSLSDTQVASIASYVDALQSTSHPGGIDLVFPGPVTEGFIAIIFGLGTAVLAAVWVERGGRG